MIAATYGRESWSLTSGNLLFSSTRSISTWAFTWTSGFKVIAKMNMTIVAPVVSAPAKTQIERYIQIESNFIVPPRNVIAVSLTIVFCFSMSWFSLTVSREDDTKEYPARPLSYHRVSESKIWSLKPSGDQTHNALLCHLEWSVCEFSP